jgi:MSHA biogenesis protein MshQ
MDAAGHNHRFTLAIALAAAVLLAPLVAQAQIAFRNAASSSAVGSGFRAAASASVLSNVVPGTATVATGAAVNSLTFSHTVASGSNRLLVVGVSFDNDNSETVTGITFGGAALTKSGSIANSDDARAEIWYLIAPTVTTANVVVSLSGTLSSERGIVAGALNLTGVHQTTPVGTFQSDEADGNPASLDVTSSAGDLVFAVYAAEQNSNSGACTQGSGQSEHWDARGGASSTTALGCGMTKTGGGTVSFSIDNSNVDHWAMGAVPIKPASTSPPTGSITIPVPSGTVQNDVMIASIGVRPSSTSITAPSGWTLVRRTNNGSGNSNSLAVYRRVAGSSEPGSYTWTLSGDTFSAGGMQSFYGIDTANPVNIENGQTTGSGTAHATPSVTTTVANAIVVTSHTYSSNRTWWPPSGMNEAFEMAVGVSASDGQAIESNYVRQAAAGSTGTKSATAAGDADVGVTHILALRPLYSGLTIAKPTGTVSGDYMVAAIGVQDEDVTITPPSGWTLVRRIEQSSGTDNALAVYTKAAGGSEPASYTWSFSDFDHAVGGIQSFSGVDTANGPVNVEDGQSEGSGTSFDTPSITPTVANVMVVTAHTFASSRTWTAPSGMTEAYDTASLTPSNSEGQSIIGSYAPHVFLATGAKTATVGGNSDTGNTHILALRPLPVTGVQGGFNAYDTSTAGGAGSGYIRTKVAGTTVSFDIAALNLPRTAVETAFTGTVKVEVLNASNNTGAMDVYGCRSSWTVLQTLSNPTFAAGNNGRMTVSFTQANSYQDLRLRVSYPTASPTIIGCSNDNFALRPNTFASYSATDNDWQTAGTTRTLNNTSIPGSVLHKAGRPFTVQATAVNGAGTPATTTNYTGSPTLTLTDCGGSSACPSTFGNVTLGASFVAGVLTTNTATYDDVGSFNLQLRDTTFANVDSGDGTPADCSASGRYVCSSTLAVGRFVPDNFAIALNTPAFGTACGSFTYVGQKFNYTTAPVITVTARNFAGGTTDNYAGSLWRITSASLTGKTYAAAAGTLDLSGLPGTDPVINSAGSGTGSLTFGSGTGLFFTRTTPVAPFDADISLAINVIDADGISSASNPAIFGTATPGNGIAFNSGKSLRFGRLTMRNVNGSQLLPLVVPVEAQYWSGAPTNAFLTNTLDNCTSLASVNDAMGNYTGNLSGSPTCETAINSAGSLSAGRGILVLAAPGSGNGGSVLITANLGAAASGSTCTTQGGAPGSATTANLPHLQGNWSGGAYDQNPTARATFGISRGAEEVVFVRENF